jgi:hypothetical protein
MPLILLMDDRYALFPYDIKALGVSYAVLGVYKITGAWGEYLYEVYANDYIHFSAERQVARNDRGWVVRYKFSFQWFEEKDPWWFAKDKGQPSKLHSTLNLPFPSLTMIPSLPKKPSPWSNLLR